MTPYEKYNQDRRQEVFDHHMSLTSLGNMMLGDCIGRGETRTVFSSPLNKDWVVKYEAGNRLHNAKEFLFYEEIVESNSKLIEWLAPCFFMSSCTKFLIMGKTTSTTEYPDDLPRAFRDIHNENFGMYNGRFVCHDYANMEFINDKKAHKLKKVNWRIYNESS